MMWSPYTAVVAWYPDGRWVSWYYDRPSGRWRWSTFGRDKGSWTGNSFHVHRRALVDPPST
jgi:hypothetical protein